MLIAVIPLVIVAALWMLLKKAASTINRNATDELKEEHIQAVENGEENELPPIEEFDELAYWQPVREQGQ